MDGRFDSDAYSRARRECRSTQDRKRKKVEEPGGGGGEVGSRSAKQGKDRHAALDRAAAELPHAGKQCRLIRLAGVILHCELARPSYLPMLGQWPHSSCGLGRA